MSKTLPPLPEWSKMDNLGGLVPSEIRQELRAYAIAAIETNGVPDGWQLMPKKLTPEMLDAAAWSGIGYASLSGFRIAWDAALASAPPAPQAKQPLASIKEQTNG